MVDMLSDYIAIENELGLIEKDVDSNKWELLEGKFSKIKQIEKKLNIDKSKNELNKDVLSHREIILRKIDALEKKIQTWMNSQKDKIEKLKVHENHLNGYKKQPSRAYYIDKSE